ncbi:hypothetical protein EXIGLDRAFT_269121 [Exidia glandulosa HHB12029]|uniref:Fungal STAND N-terminal Goodbye domain-containing protein n=1 Tax=Exidia glandulosa HHB12029 TaxID=1314781 RepID=A0A165DNK9_EXIGL|nr:hypothetical protein EXIGLDRAFT_269121 [Exidia glandulosa HHB12029]
MSGSVAFSFGSFGDITTVLQLAWSLKQILLEAGRGPSEIEELVTHIDVFTSALQQVKGVLEGRNADAPPALANGISLALRTCLQILSGMHNSLEGQKKKITGAVGRSAWLTYLATCSWLLLGGKRKVEAAKKQLSEQVDAITTLLAVANW